ncbi:thymidylate synthase [Helcococcus sueciensis]|nr:thymidylate synthase [Helcococcus sueciensis]
MNPDKKDFYSFTIDDFTLENYNPQKPNLKFEMAI